MEQHVSLIAAISALLGATAPIITKFILDFFIFKKKADIDFIEQDFNTIRTERAELHRRAGILADDLQKQIFELRTQLLNLQKDNFKYIQENAELKAQVHILLDANADLKARIVELEQEVHNLRTIKST